MYHLVGDPESGGGCAFIYEHVYMQRGCVWVVELVESQAGEVNCDLNIFGIVLRQFVLESI